jgi:hypothetical protein
MNNIELAELKLENSTAYYIAKQTSEKNADALLIKANELCDLYTTTFPKIYEIMININNKLEETK